MARMQLSTLPNEVLYLICSKLCQHCQIDPLENSLPHVDDESRRKDEKSALSNLSLTSRHMRGIAQPILYHSLHIHSIDPLDLYARVRHSQIHLSDCVRIASIRHDEDRKVSEEDTRVLKGIAASLNLGHLQYCAYSRLKLCLLEMLLAQIRNVESLDLTITFRNHKDAFTSLRHPDIEGHPATVLSALRVLQIRSHRKIWFPLERVTLLFAAAPSITHLHFDQCVGLAAPGLQQQLGAVTHLKFTESYLAWDAIRNVVRSCARLESFRFLGTNSSNVMEGAPEPFTPREAVDALLPHRTSLRELYLLLSVCSEMMDPVAEDMVDDLAEFTALEALALDSFCMCTPEWMHQPEGEADEDSAGENTRANCLSDMLPPTVKSFHIIHLPLSSDLDRSLDRLASNVQSKSVQNLSLELLHVHRVVDREISQSLEKCFADNGITFRDTRAFKKEIYELFGKEFEGYPIY